MAPQAGQAGPAGCWAASRPSCSPRLGAEALAGSPAAEPPELPGTACYSGTLHSGRRAAAEILAPSVSTLASSLMTRRSSSSAKFRTADGVVEGLNGSCGYAKVGPGQKQPLLQPSDATACILAATHAVFFFSFGFVFRPTLYIDPFAGTLA